MDLRVSKSERTLLQAVMKAGQNAYGVTIGAELDRLTREKHNIGALYALLGRLDRKGLVVSSWGEPTPERGGRRKRYYAITALGHRVMNEGLAQPSTVSFDWKVLEPPGVTT